MRKIKHLNPLFYVALVIVFTAFVFLTTIPINTADAGTFYWLICDDNSAEDGITDQVLGDQCAVGFKVPDDAIVSELAFYIYSKPGTFRINIYNSNASTNLYTRTYTATRTGWCHLPVYGINVDHGFTDDDFYVAFEPISHEQPYLGWDTNGWGYGRSMYGRPYDWQILERPLGNFMIRAKYALKPSAKEAPVITQDVDTATGTGSATFSTSSGLMHDLIATNTTACPNLNDYSYPHGFFSFKIDGIDAGSTVTVTITLPSPIPVGTEYRKCINEEWMDATPLLGDNDGDNVLTLAITDGGPGDADGVANGIILDPGGPAIPITPDILPIPRPVSESPQLPERLFSAPAKMSIKYLNVQLQQAQSNQSVNVYASIANSGDEAGSYKAELKINGKVEEIKTGILDGHAAAPLQFTVTRDKPGTYIVDVNGQQTSFNVVGEPKSGIPIDPKIIVFGLLAVLVLAMLVVLVRHFAAR